jgi:glutamate transport system substrate-binding protein
MKTTRTSILVLGAAMALSLAACGKSGTPTAGGSGAADTCTSSGAKPTVATPSISGSATYDKVKAAGTVKIGVKADQPNLGYKDTSGARCGFDIEIAQLVAAGLGIAPDKIAYTEIPSANRESAIKGGQIDYYVGTYSITDKRKNDVSFAGPYFVAGQDLLVRKDDTSITGKDTLKGKKVCSVTGSTPIQRVRDQKLTEPENVVEFKTYSECVSQLLDKKVDVVTTDDAILKGFAAQDPDQLKVVGRPFSTESYGIGLAKDDAAFAAAVRGLLQASFDDGTWQKIYDGTLGRSGSPATPPKLATS